jgi:hypothetical protein
MAELTDGHGGAPMRILDPNKSQKPFDSTG